MYKHNAYMLFLQNAQELAAEMNQIGADAPGVKIMQQKGELFHIRISNISLRAANIIKQEMLSKGGDACVHKLVSKLEADNTDILLMGTRVQFKHVIANFQIQPFGLKGVAQELKAVFTAYDKSLNPNQLPTWAEKLQLPLKKRTLIMGILNFTPDSFSDGGRYNTIEQALMRAKQMVDEGADILDIGGESTRPGADFVDARTECQRVVPIIESITKELSIPISIDTYKSEVAEAAIQAGAHIINDVWGAKKDLRMAEVAAKYQVPIILMHNRNDMNYSNLIGDIIKDIRESIEIATQKGVAEDNIILDPGIGFAKDYQQNLETMYRLRDFCRLGYPVLLGTSRKSMIAKTLELPIEERVEGTAATVALGIERGVDIVRVHDVKQMKRVSMMMDAMVRRV